MTTIISIDFVTDFIKGNILAIILAVFWGFVYESLPYYFSNPIVIIILIISVIVALLLDYLQNKKKEKEKFDKVKNKYIGFYGKMDELKPGDFRIAEYSDHYYDREEYREASELANKGKSILFIGKPKSGKTRAAYELIKGKKDFKVVKFLEKSVEIQEIPDYIFKGKIIVFLDDLNKFAKNLNLYELIKILDEESDEFIIVATCRSGKEYEIAEEEFVDNIREFNVIELKDVNEDIAKYISKQERLDIKEFDGTIGSLFLGIKDMEIRYNVLPEESKFLFQTLSLLNNARIFITNMNEFKNINLRRLEKENIQHQISFESAFKILERDSFILNENGMISGSHETYLDFSGYKTSITDLKWLKELFIEIKDVFRLFDLGNAFFYYKLFEDSIQCFDEVLQINSEFALANNNKGLALEALGKYQEAVESYDKSLEIDHDNATIINNKGVSLRKFGNPTESIECYEKAIGINPEFAQAWYNKGLAFFDLGEFMEAIECYNKAIEINPKCAEAWNNKGNTLKILNKPDDALNCFNKALEINPNLYEALSNKADVLLRMEKYSEAINYYNKSLEINPNIPEKWYYRGIALEFLDRYSEAIESYDKALEINQDNLKIWFLKGSIIGKLGDHENAMKCFNKTLELDSEHVEAWFSKGTALGHLEKHGEALKCFDKTLELDPEHAGAWYSKGVALGHLERIDEAIECFNTSLDIDPNKEEVKMIYMRVLLIKGRELAEKNNYDDAVECFDRALKLDPSNLDALELDGFYLNLLGKHDEGLKCYDKILKTNPKNLNILISKGSFLNSQGKHDKARECIKEALKIDPDNKLAIAAMKEIYEEETSC